MSIHYIHHIFISGMKTFHFSIQSVGLFFAAFMLLCIPACVDLEFDQPPAGGTDPNLPVNITIAELKDRHTLEQYEQITDDVTFSGLVISDDKEGNFFKQLVIQDATGGIEIRIEVTDLNNVYPVGRKVYVKAKGLWLGDYNGLIQLGAGVDNSNPSELELIRIPESLVDQFIIPATFNNAVTPKLLTIDQLSLDNVSTLIQLDGVQFVSSDAEETYADTVLQQSLNREIEDCAKRRVIIRSSGFASFAGTKTPEANGTLVGVLGVFGDDYQIVIRDLNDVIMTGNRCTTGGSSLTIAAVRNLFSGSPISIPSGNIKGRVTSDFSSQSVTGRNLYIQDETGGIVIRFDANHPFELGDEILIDVSGGNLAEFNGLLQIDGINTSAASLEGHPGDVTPRQATVLEILNNAQAWESTLVRIVDATLSQNTVFSGEVVVTDATGSMILFTRSFSTFASSALPTGMVTLTALLSEFNAPQLIMRNASDVSGGGTGGGDIDESFTSIADEDDIVLPGWANIAVKGTRLWRGQEFSGNHYAQATSFGDTNAEMEAWLITPAIDLTTPKKLTFESAKAFHVQDGLTVWVSSNFNGSDVEGASWTQLNPTLATAATADHEFIPSGTIDLSGFSGPVRIGFRYIGSGPGGQTSSFRIDNVKVENL